MPESWHKANRGSQPDTGAKVEKVERPRPGGSFAARFGRAILQHGIASLPSALYHFQGRLQLYAQHLWFVSYILSHKWDEDLPYPSLAVMARSSGMSKRQLQRYSDDLQKMGYLEIQRRMSEARGQETNAYDFAPLFERLEQYISMSAAERNDPSARARFNPIRAEQTQGDESHTIHTIHTVHIEEAAGRDPSFVARYGRVIARYGVAAVPRAIFTHQRQLGLEPQQVWFASYILSYQWDTSLPYPSIVKMAQHTGYTTAYLHRIKATLVESGYLRLVHRSNASGGQDSNAYDFSGLFDLIRNLLQPDEPAPDEKQAQMESTRTESAAATPPAPRRGSLAVRARTDRAAGTKGKDSSKLGLKDKTTPRINGGDAPYTRPGDASYTGGGDIQYIPPSDTEYIYPYDSTYTGPHDTAYTPGRDRQLSDPVNPPTQNPATGRTQARVTRSMHESESSYSEAKEKKDDSSRRAKRLQNGKNESTTLSSEQANTLNGSRTSDAEKPAYSHYVAQVTTDFSYELGDTEHIRENVSQAIRLWQLSGLGEQDFVQQMYEAKRGVRLGQSQNGTRGLDRKMAYYFVCLRRLLLSSEG